MRGMEDAARGPRPNEVVPSELPGATASQAPSTGKDPAAVALGRRGGLKGGKARAAKLTPAQRSAIARKAAAARWGTPESRNLGGR